MTTADEKTGEEQPVTRKTAEEEAGEHKADESRADEARAALISDIQEIKQAGGEWIVKARARLPWVIGAAAVLLLVTFGVAAIRRR